jgi:hypothetical protein
MRLTRTRRRGKRVSQLFASVLPLKKWKRSGHLRSAPLTWVK